MDKCRCTKLFDQSQTMFVQECSDVERWVVEDVEREEEEEKCSDQPKPFCQDIQVSAHLHAHC